MPKRKHDKDSDEYLLRKIKKLKKKLRRRAVSKSSSSSRSPSPPSKETVVINYLPDPELNPELDPDPEIILDDTLQDKENVLDNDILEVLGTKHIKSTEETGGKINDTVAELWENIIQNGIDNKEKESILSQTKFLPPLNCPHLIVPKMNPETLAACSEYNKKRDISIETRQKYISHAIAGLASATETVLNEVQPKDIKLKLLETLNNTGKILADIYHNENKTRRNLIVAGLDKEVRDTLLHTKPDKFLFGDNLSELIRTAKSVGKTGREIRIQPKPPLKNTSKTSQPLNWKGPPRQPQKQSYSEPHTKGIRSSGPKQSSLKRNTNSHRGYRRLNVNNQRQRRN